MQHILRFIFLFGLLATSAFAQGRISDIVIDVDKNTIPVRVSASSTELQNVAHLAFRSHGRYKLVASGHVYDLRFTAVSGTQVRVDITQGSANTPVASQTMSGKNARAALLRAADFAVERTNGLGLRGFFTAQLAFVAEIGGKKEVHTSDLFLGEAKRLTNDRSQVLTPRWSPDGGRLLYTSYFKNGFPDIFSHDLRTFERTSFVSLRGSNLSARFSPNGQQVAMVLSGEGTTEIYVSNAQGRQISRKTRSNEAKASPAWSPDGSRLVFAMEPGPQLYLMSAGGGGVQRLATGFTFSAEPDWSRTNPNKIVCTVRTGGSYQIAVYDFSKGKATQVSQAPFDGIEPCWLADARHVVFTARDRSSSVLCILDTESGRITRISTSLPNCLQANVWTP
jgi:TolB protein